MKITAFYLIMWASPVLAHDWYPWSCCSDQDCFDVGFTGVTVTLDGWRIESSGEVVPFDDPRIQETPPAGGSTFHVCHVGGDQAARVVCLFVPTGA